VSVLLPALVMWGLWTAALAADELAIRAERDRAVLDLVEIWEVAGR
jgi:hypothetical protein